MYNIVFHPLRPLIRLICPSCISGSCLLIYVRVETREREKRGVDIPGCAASASAVAARFPSESRAAGRALFYYTQQGGKMCREGEEKKGVYYI